MARLEEERRLKATEREEDNRVKISISNQAALKNPFCITDCERER